MNEPNPILCPISKNQKLIQLQLLLFFFKRLVAGRLARTYSKTDVDYMVFYFCHYTEIFSLSIDTYLISSSEEFFIFVWIKYLLQSWVSHGTMSFPRLTVSPHRHFPHVTFSYYSSIVIFAFQYLQYSMYNIFLLCILPR